MAQQKGFSNLRVAAFESRMADDMARLIARYGGDPLVAPSMQEIPLEDNHEALQFGEQLLTGRIDMLILLTGVGTRTLVEVLQTRHPREAITAALGRVTLVARGPKPVSALKELGLSPQITVPEPNTWRDILRVLDTAIAGKRIAVQEYGVPNEDLVSELRKRGALVTTVRIYRWALPEDLAPLRRVLASILAGQVAVILVTNAVQVDHVEQVLAKDGNVERFREALGRMVVASIGPTASERLRSHGWPVDLEPSHPKMGLLVKETSERAQALLGRKRSA
jgi:uroporphyrinogen-III synthase